MKKVCLAIAMSFIFLSQAFSADLEFEKSRRDVMGVHFAPSRNALQDFRGVPWEDLWRETDDCFTEDGCRVPFDNRMRNVFFRYKWMDLNPNTNQFEFDELVKAIKITRNSGKTVSLIVMAGKYTPAWLSNQVKNVNLTHANIEAGTNGSIPVPWNSTYINAYLRMMRLLKNRLDQEGIYDAIAMVKNGIITVNSAEVRMMSPDSFRYSSNLTANQKELYVCRAWAAAGYSEGLILNTMRTTNRNLASLFPHRVIGLGFVQGSSRFPTVSSGKCVVNSGVMATNKTLYKIVDQFVTDLGRKAAINSSTLNHRGEAPYGIPPWFLAMKNRGALVGFQINKQRLGCVKDTSGDGLINDKDVGCSRSEFRGTLNNALGWRLFTDILAVRKEGKDLGGAHFLEVHPNNINKYSNELKLFQKNLLHDRLGW